ncbi:unnamed protein product, partial [Rotaria sp. Silwood1]
KNYCIGHSIRISLPAFLSTLTPGTFSELSRNSDGNFFRINSVAGG